MKSPSSLKIQDPRATVRRLLSYLGNHRWSLYLAISFVVLNTAAAAVTTGLLRPVINTLAESGTFRRFVLLILLMAGTYLVSALAQWQQMIRFVRIGEDVSRSLRSDLFRKIQSLPLKFFDKNQHGEVMGYYTNDLSNINSVLEEAFSTLLTSLLSMLATLGLMLWISVPLTGLVILLIALLFLLVRGILKRSAHYFRERQTALGRLNGFIEEYLSGQKIVKVFQQEQAVMLRFDERNERLRHASSLATTFSTLMMPLIGNMSYILFAIIATIGAHLVVSGRLDLGALAAFLQATRTVLRPIANVSQQFNLLFAAIAGAERVFAVLDLEPELDEGTIDLVEHEGRPYWRLSADLTQAGRFPRSGLKLDEAAPDQDELAPGLRLPALNERKDLLSLADGSLLVPRRGDLRFLKLEFAYDPEKPIIRGLSFALRPGERVALVGSTGAGKTTISTLLHRFYELGGGQILIDGIPLPDIRKSCLRQVLGFVLQEVLLFEGSIRDNIRYGRLEAGEAEIEEAARYANAGFIRKLQDGFDTVLLDNASNLSQGQRQLLSIARAAVADPLVLVLDEATSSVDTRTEAQIQRGMDSLMKERTTLVIAHRLSTIQGADHILLLENGKILEQGRHEELMARQGQYYALQTGASKLQ